MESLYTNKTVHKRNAQPFRLFLASTVCRVVTPALLRPRSGPQDVLTAVPSMRSSRASRSATAISAATASATVASAPALIRSKLGSALT